MHKKLKALNDTIHSLTQGNNIHNMFLLTLYKKSDYLLSRIEEFQTIAALSEEEKETFNIHKNLIIKYKQNIENLAVNLVIQDLILAKYGEKSIFSFSLIADSIKDLLPCTKCLKP